VRLAVGDIEGYLSLVAELLERYGVVLDLEPGAPLVLEESPTGALSFVLRGYLPDGRVPPLSVVEVRELWRRSGSGQVERWGYAYELIDHERRVRRAFHMHDRDDFVRRFQVAVHEHCEAPVGAVRCPHIMGPPVRDAFRGVELLLQSWIDPVTPDFAAMTCLE
jgi:hypothetical protein